MVGMFITSTEYGINKVAAPVHLQRLKSFFLLVCGFHAISASASSLSITIVSIPSSTTDGCLIRKRQMKRFCKRRQKKIDTDKGEPLEKSFDHMGRGHLRLNTSGIVAILFKMIKVDQMPAGAIQQEAKHLLEKPCYFNSFLALSHGSEHSVQHGKNLDGMQVGYKKSQAFPPCQFVLGWLNLTDFCSLSRYILLLFAISFST